MPSAGRIMTIGMVAVFGTGVVVFLIARVAGLSTGNAGLLGLLAMFVGMGWYGGSYLRGLSRKLDATMREADQ
jgi:hypothetical protein